MKRSRVECSDGTVGEDAMSRDGENGRGENGEVVVTQCLVSAGYVLMSN